MIRLKSLIKEELELVKLPKSDQTATGKKFYFTTDDGYWGYADSREEAEALVHRGTGQDRRLDRKALRSSYKKEALSVPDKHLLKIARDSLKMPDAMLGVMGGPDKETAKKIIVQLTKKEKGVKEAEDEPEMFPNTWEDPDMGPEELPVDRTSSQWKAMSKGGKSKKENVGLKEVSKEKMAELRAAVEAGRMTQQQFLQALQSSSTKKEATGRPRPWDSPSQIAKKKLATKVVPEAREPHPKEELGDYMELLGDLADKIEDLESRINPQDKDLLLKAAKNARFASEYLRALREKY